MLLCSICNIFWMQVCNHSDGTFPSSCLMPVVY
jgi:hypothetical protein